MTDLIVDIGIEAILLPGQQKWLQYAPQSVFRVDRLFIEERFGVTLYAVKVGNQDQQWTPVSTLFYSVPSCPKTIDRIRELIAKENGREPDVENLRFVWDDRADPDAAMGLPVWWEVARVGNQIQLLLLNRSADPVRITAVLRGTSVI